MARIGAEGIQRFFEIILKTKAVYLGRFFLDLVGRQCLPGVEDELPADGADRRRVIKSCGK
jgi:hypothetical protein